MRTLVGKTVLLIAMSGSVACGGGDSGSSGGAGSSGTSGGAGGAAGSGGATAQAGSGGKAGGTSMTIGSSGCPLFTADDDWNKDVSGAAVDATWSSNLATLVGAVDIHPDFGPGFGIPFNVVSATQPALDVTFDGYADESDAGPYAFPDVGVARVEGTDDPHACDGDCHLLSVQQGSCMLYEGYACHYDTAGWVCSNGAIWDLTKKSYGQRPEGWTSVDAAGLPVYAGLARYEEVMAGEITHAIRFTVNCTTGAHIPPASHDAEHGTCDPAVAPPMGLRVRLKADFDESGFSTEAQVFLRAFKKYGMILADNGSNFFFQSEDNPNWSDGINDLKQVPASAFEVVQ